MPHLLLIYETWTAKAAAELAGRNRRRFWRLREEDPDFDPAVSAVLRFEDGQELQVFERRGAVVSVPTTGIVAVELREGDAPVEPPSTEPAFLRHPSAERSTP
jgi:hypothetical protein